MLLDQKVCSRARLARDARFDGKFFIAVITTKIYCRPICRSRTSKESNVRYFASAAAAAEAGFRPCLRCRPEQSPGTPAWAGTRNTVTRALRLINETGLEGGVEALAGHLGVGSRHLCRLFRRHLGATPSAVARTSRLQFAKKLIDETSLPMIQIALASGFGSVRRFNGAIRSCYDRTPSQIRRLARKTPSEAEHQYFFRLSFRPPYDWPRLLKFLAAQAIPGVEFLEDGIYRRSIYVNEDRGYLEASLCPAQNALDVRVQIGKPRSLFLIIERVRAMFDLDADWTAIARTLGSDPVLGSYASSHPGLRVPGCWNGFEFATRMILEQQPGGATAGLAGHLVRTFGQPFAPVSGLTHLFPTPEVLASANMESLIGLPAEQAASIRALSSAVCNGQITFEKVVDSAALLRRLAEIPGMAKSTIAQWMAVRALRDPDAFPSLDRDVARALGLPPGSIEFEKRSLAWRPWRAYAAMYLLSFADQIRRTNYGPSKIEPVPKRTGSLHSMATPIHRP